MKRNKQPSQEVHGEVVLLSMTEESPEGTSIGIMSTEVSAQGPQRETPAWLKTGLWCVLSAAVGGAAMHTIDHPREDSQAALHSPQSTVQMVDVMQSEINPPADVDKSIPVGTAVDIMCADYGFNLSMKDEYNYSYGPQSYKFFANAVHVAGRALSLHIRVLTPAAPVKDCNDLPDVGPVPTVPGVVVADSTLPFSD
jgi:hypothetical protein